MSDRAIEIYYDIAAIPDIADRSDFSGEALTFRNEAMHHIEGKLAETGEGEWEGAEIGMGEVNFGFAVSDFERAETVVRSAVAGTRYDCIREITRVDYSEFDA